MSGLELPKTLSADAVDLIQKCVDKPSGRAIAFLARVR